MRRFLTLCLTALIFGALLSTTLAAEADTHGSGKALATFSCDNPQSAVSDSDGGDNDALVGLTFLAAWAVPHASVVLPDSAQGQLPRATQHIRAPPARL